MSSKWEIPLARGRGELRARLTTVTLAPLLANMSTKAARAPVAHESPKTTTSAPSVPPGSSTSATSNRDRNISTPRLSGGLRALL